MKKTYMIYSPLQTTLNSTGISSIEQVYTMIYKAEAYDKSNIFILTKT